MANPLDTWKQHAEFTQAAKGLTGKGEIPEYGMQTGYDFQKKYNLNPKVSSVLASGWQLAQEGVRGLGKYLTGNPGALKDALGTAKKQSAQNIEGILAAHAGTLTPEQQQIRNKYLEGVSQKPDAPFIDPTGKNLFTEYGYEDEDEYDFSGIEGQTAGLGVASFLKAKFGPKVGAYLFKKGKLKTQQEMGQRLGPIIKKKISGGGGGNKIITKKKKISAPPGEKGGPGYISPKKKYTPPARPHSGGSGNTGQATSKSSGKNYGPYSKADGGLINFYKYGGFIG